MKPPRWLEGIVGLFLPPAVREEVLGDLRERALSMGGYVKDAVNVIPYVWLSRILRTADPAMLLMEALLLYASQLLAALWLDPARLAREGELWRLAVPPVVALGVLRLIDAWRSPGIHRLWECAFSGFAVAAGLAVQAIWFPAPAWILFFSTVMSLLTVSAVRMMFPPPPRQLKG